MQRIALPRKAQAGTMLHPKTAAHAATTHLQDAVPPTPQTGSGLRRRAGRFTRGLVGVGALCLWGLGNLDSTCAQESVTVVGARLGAKPEDGPLLRLEGAELEARRGSTLGETLGLLPGVQHSAFGPNSSRPVIRGLDQDRVRILQGGGGVQDLSSFSADHAVAVDMLLVDRIEILRGPAALLYGGNAMGGVIDLVDQRIIRQADERASSRLLLQAGNQASDRQVGVVLARPLLSGGQASERAGDSGLQASGAATPQLFGHLDVAGYRAGDTRTPAFSLSDPRTGAVDGPFRRIRNSATEQYAAGAGLSLVGSGGYLGAAIDEVRKDYGVTAEEATRIAMRRLRSRLEGERLIGGAQDVRLGFRLGQTDYRHNEKEDAELTRFRNRSNDWRTVLTFGRAGQYSGVVGLEGERQRFSAVDEEGGYAFVPPNDTRKTAAFVLQRVPLGASEVQFAARQEEVEVHAESLGAEGAGLRRFVPRSFSVSLGVPLAQGMSVLASLSRAERAPAAFELLADGIHHAAGTFEKGDSALPTEKGDLADLSFNYRQGEQRVRIAVFQSRFARYIGLVRDPNLDTVHDHHHVEDALAGADHGMEGHESVATVPGYRYQALRARFRGLEFVWTTRLQVGRSSLRPLVQCDLTEASNTTTGEPLPRIAPRRWVLAVAWSGQTGGGHGWLVRPEAVLHARARLTPEDVESGSIPAPSSRLLNLYAAVEPQGWKILGGGVSFFLRARNLTDQLAYNATALPNIRPLAPLGGRSVQLGMQLRL